MNLIPWLTGGVNRTIRCIELDVHFKFTATRQRTAEETVTSVVQGISLCENSLEELLLVDEEVRKEKILPAIPSLWMTESWMWMSPNQAHSLLQSIGYRNHNRCPRSSQPHPCQDDQCQVKKGRASRIF